ncbi:hypothetical protein Nepgr_015900 [Nepenthes gracilis]|uniref:Uncharacterized protein n=1 Tax=Nepenthes gracilis TaxID=150966 RepID=A0AAD3SNL1_NEPGR|nr:hypothetical protein Nepgr_015900 [Nepenthes gracilis]
MMRLPSFVCMPCRLVWFGNYPYLSWVFLLMLETFAGVGARECCSCLNADGLLSLLQLWLADPIGVKGAELLNVELPLSEENEPLLEADAAAFKRPCCFDYGIVDEFLWDLERFFVSSAILFSPILKNCRGSGATIEAIFGICSSAAAVCFLGC